MEKTVLIFVFGLFILGCSNHAVDISKVDYDEFKISNDSVATNLIVCWGHSGCAFFTPHFSALVRKINGNDKYDIKECGISGERMLEIAARQGSIPCFISSSIVIDSSHHEFASSKIGDIKSTFNNDTVNFLYYGICEGVNPCIIDGKKLNLIPSNILTSSFSIAFKDLDNKASETLAPNSLVYTYGSLYYRYPTLSIFWCDQAADRANIKELIKKYEMMVSYAGNIHYLIIGSILGTKSERQELENALTKTFGKNYFNSRDYLSRINLKNYNLDETNNDSIAKKEGRCQPSLMKDNLHLNNIGNEILSEAVYQYLVSNNILNIK